MPLYEYVCRACHTDFEALLPASRRDAADTACPHLRRGQDRPQNLADGPARGQRRRTLRRLVRTV